MNDRKPLIMIVEDEEDMAYLNEHLLKRQGYDTLIAYSASEARAFASANSPDLFVLDVGLPDGSGWDLCKELRQSSDAPVLFLTGRSETSDKIRGLGTGGDYYLTKPYDKNEFIAVVQSLLRRAYQVREKLAEASVIERGSLSLRLDDRKAFVNGHDAELTLKEFAVLLMLVQHEDCELSGEEIYRSVWGASMNKDPNAIRLTISRLKKKLDEENAVDYGIFTKYKGGYTFTRL